MTDEELIEELSEMGRHPCRAHLPMGETLRQAADRIEALTAEVERLRHCLKNANDKHEFYEREWYLRGDRIEALTAENERLLVSNEQWQVDYNEAVIDKLELETKIKRLRGIGLHLVQHINWVTNGLPDLLEDACLTDEEGVINAAIAAATEARAALEKQP
jgi:FtsZ-binding cell division protein ZapB